MPFDDVDMVGSWVYGLTLVDADGKPLRASLGYGEGNWGVGSGVADYVFSHEDAYPEQVYLAPQTGGGQRGYGVGDSTPHAEVSNAAAFCAAAAGRFLCCLVFLLQGESPLRGGEWRKI